MNPETVVLRAPSGGLPPIARLRPSPGITVLADVVPEVCPCLPARRRSMQRAAGGDAA